MDINCFIGSLLVMSLAACYTYYTRIETDLNIRHKKPAPDSSITLPDDDLDD